MTAAVYRSGTPSLSVPQIQSTAPVLEFACLYTHDLRRKAKRWQDGFLRFHTFNKRVMVYDVPRNYIGDTHWTADEPLAEGDELSLEKACVLVQVEEQRGRTETDLSELRQSVKKKRSSGHGSSSPARRRLTPAPASVNGTAAAGTAVRLPTQLKHGTLNALLGASKGPVGKAALPTRSPFEQRLQEAENQEWEDGGPPKRKRTDSAPACNVTRATTKPNPNASEEMPLCARAADTSKQRTKRADLRPGQQRLGTKEVIDLSEGADLPEDRFLPSFSSDVLAPSSPRKETPVVARKPDVCSSSPAFQNQQVPLMKRAQTTVPTAQGAVAPRNDRPSDALPAQEHLCSPATFEREPTDRPPDRARRRLQDDGTFRDLSEPKPAKPPAPPKPSESTRQASSTRPSTSIRSGATLRTASAPQKKKTLACQGQLMQKPNRLSSTRTADGVERLLDAASANDIDAPTGQREGRRKTQREQLEERLARIDAKKQKRAAVMAGSNNELPSVPQAETDADPFLASGGMRKKTLYEGWEASRSSGTQPAELQREDRATTLAQLDQMLLGPAPAEPLLHERQPQTQAPPAKVNRPFRRVLSETAARHSEPGTLPQQSPQLQKVLSETSCIPSGKPRRVPGAPMRFTPSPVKRPESRSGNAVAAAKTATSPTEPRSVVPGGQTLAAPSTGTHESEDAMREPETAPKEGMLEPYQRTDSGVKLPTEPRTATPAPPPPIPVLQSTTTTPPPPLPEPTSAVPRRKLGVGRREIRKAAATALDASANGTSMVVLNRPFQAPKSAVAVPSVADAEVEKPGERGPWSREAFDLFVWRPPGWDEDEWCVRQSAGT